MFFCTEWIKAGNLHEGNINKHVGGKRDTGEGNTLTSQAMDVLCRKGLTKIRILILYNSCCRYT